MCTGETWGRMPHDACHDSQNLSIISSIKWKLMTQFKTIIINIAIVRFFVVINNWQAEKWPFYIWAGVLHWKFFWCWVAGSLIWVLSVKFSIWYRTGLVINISLLSSSAVSFSCQDLNTLTALIVGTCTDAMQEQIHILFPANFNFFTFFQVILMNFLLGAVCEPLNCFNGL